MTRLSLNLSKSCAVEIINSFDNSRFPLPQVGVCHGIKEAQHAPAYCLLWKTNLEISLFLCPIQDVLLN